MSHTYPTPHPMFYAYQQEKTESSGPCTCGDSRVCECVFSFFTCGSRAAVVWRWGCRLLASSADETASRFLSPASGRSLRRSCAPGSPYTRCAPTPGSPDRGKNTGRVRTEKRVLKVFSIRLALSIIER